MSINKNWIVGKFTCRNCVKDEEVPEKRCAYTQIKPFQQQTAGSQSKMQMYTTGHK